MAEDLVGTYARALAEAARDMGVLEEIREAAAGLAEAIERDRDLAAYVTSLSVPRARKAAVLVEALGPILPHAFVKFLGLVLEHGREDVLPQILAKLPEAIDLTLGRVHAEIISATPLRPDTRVSLEAALAKRLGAESVVRERLDPDIIGGLVVRYGDRVVDGSVRERLRRMRGHLMSERLGSEYIHENQG